MTINTMSRSVEQYDQTRQYHPFARPIDAGQWIVEEPGRARPLGYVRSRPARSGEIEFVVWPWHDESITVRPFEGSHPTLFHAVSWLRWRMDERAA